MASKPPDDADGGEYTTTQKWALSSRSHWNTFTSRSPTGSTPRRASALSQRTSPFSSSKGTSSPRSSSPSPRTPSPLAPGPSSPAAPDPSSPAARSPSDSKAAATAAASPSAPLARAIRTVRSRISVHDPHKSHTAPTERTQRDKMIAKYRQAPNKAKQLLGTVEEEGAEDLGGVWDFKCSGLDHDPMAPNEWVGMGYKKSKE